MAHFKSIIAYDGTDFRGFQRQGAGERTVQSEFERALRAIGWEGHSILGAGRTDAGVHASGQVVAYKLAWEHSAAALTRALNANLPPDLSVWQSEPVRSDFHPRFAASGRRYRYDVVLAEFRDPLRERYAWRLWPPPNLGDMGTAAERLLGERDFGAFGQAPIPGGHTVRTVSHASWVERSGGLSFFIAADAFLYRMVRRIVAATLEVGYGRTQLVQFEALLADPESRWEGPLAPAQGLTLEAVIYENDSWRPR